jgi:hypothetical protein
VVRNGRGLTPGDPLERDDLYLAPICRYRFGVSLNPSAQDASDWSAAHEAVLPMCLQ